MRALPCSERRWCELPLRLNTVLLTALVWTGASGVARGDETGIAVEHRGRCPRAELLLQRLEPGFRLCEPGAPGAWTLRVAAPRGPALRMVLLSPGGEVSLTRQLASADCRARAEAVVIILNAHFLKLALPAALDPRRPELRVEGAASRPLSPAPASAPARPPRPLSRPRVSAGKRVPAGRATALRLVFGLSAAADLGLAPERLAAAGQLDVGFLFGRHRLGPRLTAVLGHATEQEGRQDRVELRRGILRLDAALLIGRGRWWMLPLAGAGLAIERAVALDLEARPGATVVQPLVSAALAAGLRLTGWLSVRAELTASAVLMSHRYLVNPQGEVARSPWGSLSLGLGLQVDREWSR